MSSEICMHAALAAGAAAGCYVFHCTAAEAIIYEGTGGQVSGATALHRPVLLLTNQQLVALTSGGIRLAAALPLRGADRGPTPSHPVFKSLSAHDQMVRHCMKVLCFEMHQQQVAGSALFKQGCMHQSAVSAPTLSSSFQVPSFSRTTYSSS